MHPDLDIDGQARRRATGRRASVPATAASGSASAARDVAGTAPSRGGLARRVATLAACLVLPLLVSGCVKQGISPKAAEVHRIFYIILWLALPVFAFVEGMLLVSIIWFRKRRGDETTPPQTPGNRGAVAAFFAGPLAIVIVLLAFGEPAVARVDHLDPNPAEKVVVTGFQWEWSAQYVDEGVTVTGKTLKQAMIMELPVDTTTQIELRSTDVIHEFFVPDLLLMKNAIPGHPNFISITPTKVGTYHGQCAQYCGLWHSKMEFVLKVVPKDEFQSWLTDQKQVSTEGGESCQPTGSDVTLVAAQVSWDKSCIAVTADKPFQLTIDNQDREIDHNFAIYQSSDLKKRLYLSPDVDGPDKKTFTVPALPAGTYYFQCDIHGPAMAGTLVVG